MADRPLDEAGKRVTRREAARVCVKEDERVHLRTAILVIPDDFLDDRPSIRRAQTAEGASRLGRLSLWRRIIVSLKKRSFTEKRATHVKFTTVVCVVTAGMIRSEPIRAESILLG